jgi:hypothetical protein
MTSNTAGIYLSGVLFQNLISFQENHTLGLMTNWSGLIYGLVYLISQFVGIVGIKNDWKCV